VGRDWLLLVFFLLLLGLIVFGAHLGSQKSKKKQIIPTGASLYINKGCRSCHQPYSSSGCPNLANFSQKPLIIGKVANTRSNLRKWLKNPASIKFGTRMPNLRLTDEEIELLIDYIQTL
jgi:cytochrome c oxidase subunit 2